MVVVLETAENISEGVVLDDTGVQGPIVVVMIGFVCVFSYRFGNRKSWEHHASRFNLAQTDLPFTAKYREESICSQSNRTHNS